LRQCHYDDLIMLVVFARLFSCLMSMTREIKRDSKL